MENFSNIKIAILGSGESGTGAAILATKLGYKVFVSDKLKIKDVYREELVNRGIEFEEGYHTEGRLYESDIIIKSPGIPDGISLIRELRAAGKEVIDEIEFAARHAKGKIIAITGTNGKTTTTRLIYQILKTAGLNAALGGNIGQSFAKVLSEGEHDYYVLEISSFQLDGITSFKPFVAVLTNITPDHLDRYQYKFENYVKSKFSIIQNQDSNDNFIYNTGNEPIATYIKANGSGKGKAYPVQNELFEETEKLQINTLNILKDSLLLRGKHNYHNIACAVTAAQIVGVSDEKISEALVSFRADAHRMEPCGIINGIEYINDSKATNVDSVWYALDAMTKPTVWICGGQDKGNEYAALSDLVKAKVKAIVCLTTDPQKIHDAFEGTIKEIHDAQSAEEAVRIATGLAKSGDVVLLSPACASFDLFKNYEDRGGQFKAAVGLQ